MQISSAARRVQTFIAVFVGVALLLRLGLTLFHPDADSDPHVLVRLERFVSFFTIQSNFVVLLAALAVACDRVFETPWSRALRLAALVGITVTGIVYIAILAGDSHQTGLSQVANLMLHYIAPPLTVLAWLAFGPWQALSFADIPRALAWPAAWIAYTLGHGAITDWYPYGFIDVVAKGYGRVFVSIGFITLFAAVLSCAFIGLSNLRRRPTPAP